VVTAPNSAAAAGSQERPQQAEAIIAHLRAEVERLAAERNMLLSSTLWRATWPLRIVGQHIPSPARRLIRGGTKLVWWSLRLQLRRRLRERREALAAIEQLATPSATASEPTVPLEPATADVFETGWKLFPELGPLRTFPSPQRGCRRLTLVTDSISTGSLYGGVGTGLLLGAALARRMKVQLRIVTECVPPDPNIVAALFDRQGIDWEDDIEFVFSDRRDGKRRAIEARENDMFLATAWWTTWNTLQAVSPRQIICLIQEDERMFYPQGDSRLRASEIMRRPDIRFIVNSRLLWDHLRAEGFHNIHRNGVFFEPAFPKTIYYWEERQLGREEKLQFMFYARPHHPRNLYVRGLEAINAALERAIIDPGRWEICFAGSNLSDLRLARNVSPRLVQNLPWHEYAALVRGTDLGLCLMYTPLPSYPPLDLAASGAAVVTTRFGSKRSLSSY
jgi:hypothetical protein